LGVVRLVAPPPGLGLGDMRQNGLPFSA
jgi:hypothetical protein